MPAGHQQRRKEQHPTPHHRQRSHIWH
jgi:hypothetical protein